MSYHQLQEGLRCAPSFNGYLTFNILRFFIMEICLAKNLFLFKVLYLSYMPILFPFKNSPIKYFQCIKYTF